jgi:predicted dehydrogenase
MSDQSRKSAKKPVRLVVAGAGLIGRAHIRRILGEPEAELVGIADPSPKATAQAEELGIAWSDDLDALLRQTKPDGVVIASPNPIHFSMGMIAIRHGVAALLEKPVCETLEEARALSDAAEKAGVAILVGHHRRHSPLIQRAKDIVASGRLGKIAAIHGFSWLLKPTDYFEGAGAWRAKPGGGVILINLIHAVDDLRNLCGDVESVQAMTSNGVRGFAVEDTAGALLRFRNGAIGTLTLSDATASPLSWEMTSGENKSYPRSEEACYMIAGTAGSLTVPRLEVWDLGENGHWWRPLHAQRSNAPEQDPFTLRPLSDPLTNQMAHFCQVARKEAKPLLDARGGARTLELALAVKHAAETGETVRIDE